MKLPNTVLLFAAILFCHNVQAQKKIEKRETADIVNPESRQSHLPANYFTPAITNMLLKQITKTKLEDIKKYAEEDNYPDCIQTTLEILARSDNKKETKEFFESLKVYRIAKFNNISSGKNTDEQSILLVPASENKNVYTDCNYTRDFYIIIPTKDITVYNF
jgi:PleD family two-component response regulator